jgi:sirohydrochlorin cobaltochelatase
MTKTALVLAGHGSHISPNTAGLVWEQVDKLRALNIADEVTAAFWKEMPSFHTVLNTLEADDITIVPLFTAQGYFTQTVIPAEMGLSGAITERDGRTIRYTRTLGEHSHLLKVVEDWVDSARDVLNAPPEEIAIAIIGHSTRRNPSSRKASQDQAAHLRQLGIFAQVEAVYLDDSPAIADIYDMTSAPNIIALPFFLADGSHTTIDVVRELGLDENTVSQKVKGRNVYYTPPIGLTQNLTTIILELAHESGAPLYPPREGSAWDCFPGNNRHAKILWGILGHFKKWDVGELRLTQTEVRHRLDENPAEILTEPDELRRFVRQNLFRPLATSKDLPHGWRMPVKNAQHLWAIVETIYPGAASYLSGFAPQQKFNTLSEVVARQTGQYRSLDQLTLQQQGKIVEQVCRKCVQIPYWFSENINQNYHLLCPEPCNFWLSAAVKELAGEKEEQ